MSPSPFDLLRLLGSGVRATTEPTPAKPVEDSDFKELLTKAKAGQVPSGIEARVADGVSISLTPEQMKRLTVAGDKAESAGASRAMILMDGLALTMDVGTRTITRAVKASSVGVAGDVDAVISADAPGPASHASGDALLRALAPPGERDAA